MLKSRPHFDDSVEVDNRGEWDHEMSTNRSEISVNPDT